MVSKQPFISLTAFVSLLLIAAFADLGVKATSVTYSDISMIHVPFTIGTIVTMAYTISWAIPSMGKSVYTWGAVMTVLNAIMLWTLLDSLPIVEFVAFHFATATVFLLKSDVSAMVTKKVISANGGT